MPGTGWRAGFVYGNLVGDSGSRGLLVSLTPRSRFPCLLCHCPAGAALPTHASGCSHSAPGLQCTCCGGGEGGYSEAKGCVCASVRQRGTSNYGVLVCGAGGIACHGEGSDERTKSIHVSSSCSRQPLTTATDTQASFQPLQCLCCLGAPWPESSLLFR